MDTKLSLSDISDQDIELPEDFGLTISNDIDFKDIMQDNSMAILEENKNPWLFDLQSTKQDDTPKLTSSQDYEAKKKPAKRKRGRPRKNKTKQVHIDVHGQELASLDKNLIRQNKKVKHWHQKRDCGTITNSYGAEPPMIVAEQKLSYKFQSEFKRHEDIFFKNINFTTIKAMFRLIAHDIEQCKGCTDLVTCLLRWFGPSLNKTTCSALSAYYYMNGLCGPNQVCNIMDQLARNPSIEWTDVLNFATTKYICDNRKNTEALNFLQ